MNQQRSTNLSNHKYQMRHTQLTSLTSPMQVFTSPPVLKAGYLNNQRLYNDSPILIVRTSAERMGNHQMRYLMPQPSPPLSKNNICIHYAHISPQGAEKGDYNQKNSPLQQHSQNFSLGKPVPYQPHHVNFYGDSNNKNPQIQPFSNVSSITSAELKMILDILDQLERRLTGIERTLSQNIGPPLERAQFQANYVFHQIHSQKSLYEWRYLMDYKK